MDDIEKADAQARLDAVALKKKISRAEPALDGDGACYGHHRYDLAFYEKLPELFPNKPTAGAKFEGNDMSTAANAFRNGMLQRANFILAGRTAGLDAGPMPGFNNESVDEMFFVSASLKSNFICALGYAYESKIFRRLPRLEFDDVAQMV